MEPVTNSVPVPSLSAARSLLAGPERPPKIAELVARRIVADIARRHMEPGDRLPPEAEMIETVGVGRGTLREALRYLELQGIITMKPGAGGGPIVAAPNARGLASSFALVLQATRTPFSTIVQARAMLEPLVAAEAARNAEIGDVLDILEDSAAKIGQTLGDTDAYLAENARFHEAIAIASGNALFAFLMASLHWIIDGSSLGVAFPDWSKEVTIRAHRRIYEAIRDRNPDAAYAAMRKHNVQFEGYMAEHYPEALGRIVSWD
jgi:DNA-binding FadR family transcriptional regulator